VWQSIYPDHIAQLPARIQEPHLAHMTKKVWRRTKDHMAKSSRPYDRLLPPTPSRAEPSSGCIGRGQPPAAAKSSALPATRYRGRKHRHLIAFRLVPLVGLCLCSAYPIASQSSYMVASAPAQSRIAIISHNRSDMPVLHYIMGRNRTTARDEFCQCLRLCI
jgi:hypothetical protein